MEGSSYFATYGGEAAKIIAAPTENGLPPLWHVLCDRKGKDRAVGTLYGSFGYVLKPADPLSHDADTLFVAVGVTAQTVSETGLPAPLQIRAGADEKGVLKRVVVGRPLAVAVH